MQSGMGSVWVQEYERLNATKIKIQKTTADAYVTSKLYKASVSVVSRNAINLTRLRQSILLRPFQKLRICAISMSLEKPNSKYSDSK